MRKCARKRASLTRKGLRAHLSKGDFVKVVQFWNQCSRALFFDDVERKKVVHNFDVSHHRQFFFDQFSQKMCLRIQELKTDHRLVWMSAPTHG